MASPHAPIHSADGHAVYAGDCRSILPAFPDAFAQLVLTDPPYDASGTESFVAVVPELARCLAPGGSLVVLCGAHQMPSLLAAAAAHLRYWWIGGMSSQTITRVFGKDVNTRFKPALWFVKDRLRRTGRAPLDLHHGRYKGDKRFHPHGQPVEWFENWVERLTNERELVLDCFAGAGSVAIAAQRLGRFSVSVELDEVHASTIVKRLNDER